ncbi:GNAT family N-acetyltransferase [Streptomyces sp. NBC_00124]|uniref:GNAT family N-acetyltransferase n=1 Tax=Streptomyces sp. NBC_00124 TaxID=2975662 RepID=UPI002259A770|nr:GNAT family N-acetyltransferase [Streptomyces sp. NBC_00124]MCX5359731.1 GNAT family N-acetyltransferase [Streptomyces sp. NBC_00124]
MPIAPGTVADADRIAALHTASWRSAYAALLPTAYLHGPVAKEHREQWRARTASLAPDRLLLVAHEDGELHGFVYLCTTADGRVHVDNLHVRPDRVGTGLGRSLLRRGLAWAAAAHPGRDVFLEVLRGNDRAIVFYERQGGLRTAERPLRLAPDLVVDEVEYTWPAAQVGRPGEDGPEV